MARRLGRRMRLLAIAGVVFHALFVVAAPFEHHDLICHLKTPQHCPSCLLGPVSSHPHTHAAAAPPQLADAGSATALDLVLEAALLTTSCTGRSPPHAL